MAALPPPSSQLQRMLQAAVQSVQWTYSLFWQLCPQQGLLVWANGYYNGAIKTRKTVQHMEVTAEEASIQRSQQLRELYESLLAGETNQLPTKRPSAALSPEDLTESEWFYLMCVSFSFPPGSGLPGKAYARRQHVWLTGANEVDSKTFSRAILAKSVVCIPLLDGVVELGTTDKVQEDLGFIKHIKSYFTDHHQQQYHPTPPKPALSEHSTSNPSSLHSALLPPINNADPLVNAVDQDDEINADDADEDLEEEDDDDDDDEEPESNSVETGRRSHRVGVSHSGGASLTAGCVIAEPSELMQLEMSEDIRLGSPEDASNNLESDFPLLPVRRSDSVGAESTRRWPALQDQLNSSSLQQPSSEFPISLQEDDSHYSQTVSTILQPQPTFWVNSSSTAPCVGCISNQSAFAKWNKHFDPHVDPHVQRVADGAPQWLVKYILFTVPFLHNKRREETSSPKSHASDEAGKTLASGTLTPQDELSANHVLAERRRREKLNERFVILRSLVPFVTKVDKASILGDTIEYVKQLRKKIQDLEARNGQIEIEQQQKWAQSSRKMRIAKASGGGGAKPKAAAAEAEEDGAAAGGTLVEVSIIESDALLEIRCEYREGMLLEILQLLRELRIETTGVQTSVNGGVFMAEIRAKVKESVKGKKASIMEVKRAINQIIP